LQPCADSCNKAGEPAKTASRSMYCRLCVSETDRVNAFHFSTPAIWCADLSLYRLQAL
jgi:hypothetical protein